MGLWGVPGVCKFTHTSPCEASLLRLEYLKVSGFIANGGVLYPIYSLSSQTLWISDGQKSGTYIHTHHRGPSPDPHPHHQHCCFLCQQNIWEMTFISLYFWLFVSFVFFFFFFLCLFVFLSRHHADQMSEGSQSQK